MKNYKQIQLSKIDIPSYYMNAKENQKFQVLKAVIAKRGQTSVIHIREKDDGAYELIAGRNVFQCLNDLGLDSAVCYNHGKVNLEEAKLIYLELGLQEYESDTVELAQLIEDVSKVYTPDQLTKTLPFSTKEIEVYMSYLTYDWVGLWNSFKQAQYEAKKKKEAKKLKEQSEVSVTPTELAEAQLQRLYEGIFKVA